MSDWKLSGLKAEFLDDRQFRLLEDVTVEGQHETFVVPQGFITDLASIPRVLWWVYPPYGSYSVAAVLHDWLWRCSKGEIEDCDPVDPLTVDGMFRRVMRLSGTSFFARWLMWGAVRSAAVLDGRIGGFGWWIVQLGFMYSILIATVFTLGLFLF